MLNKEEIEAIKLKKQQGCKTVNCGVVDNNIKLRIENIQLKKQIEQLENKVKYLREKAEENATDYYSEVSRNAKLEEKVNKIIEYCKKYEDEYEWIQTVDDEYQRMTGRALACEEILNLIEGEND